MFMPSIGAIAASAIVSTVATTWNPADKHSSINLSNGDLTAIGTTNAGLVRATVGKTSGTYYYECVKGDTFNGAAGVANAAATLVSSLISGNTSTMGVRNSDGTIWSNSSLKTGNIGTLAVNDVIGIAVDITNGKFYARKNGGAWHNSGDPVAGTGGSTFTPSSTIYPACSMTAAGCVWHARFASSSWGTAAPIGYLEWA